MDRSIIMSFNHEVNIGKILKLFNLHFVFGIPLYSSNNKIDYPMRQVKKLIMLQTFRYQYIGFSDPFYREEHIVPPVRIIIVI